MSKTTTKKYTYNIGRRKSSITTIKLFKGQAESLVNGQKLDHYFKLPHLVQTAQLPLIVTSTQDKFYFEAKCRGGGQTSQAQSLSLALAKSLDRLDANFHSDLKSQSLLSVDSRVRQRRQIGTGGKSRRQKQSPKR